MFALAIQLIFMSICADAKILPGLEEHHAPDVTHRKELARQALPLSGWRPQRVAENLPSLEGWLQITIAICHFMIYAVKHTYAY